MKTYHDRAWLNKKGVSSSGSVMAFRGKSPWDDGQKIMSVLEITDCHGKIRLHQADRESDAAFVTKLRKLARVVTRFADAIERHQKGEEKSVSR